MKFIGFLIFPCLLAVASGTAGETTTLEELLATRSARPGPGVPIRPLKVAWVGDIRNGDGTVTKLRLDHGGIPDAEKEPMLVRMRGKSYLGSEAFWYMDDLPKPEDLLEIKSLAGLESIFGKPLPVIDGWEEDGRIHWFAEWERFTRKSADRLDCLLVSTTVSKDARGADDRPIRVDRISLSHGVLRPANLDSKEELLEYPTGEALFMAGQEKLKRERGKFPEPLRSLVAARDHPDDSDLVHWRAFLNGVRKEPDPRLFQQLIQELDEGTTRMRSAFESILVDDWLKLEPWQPAQRAIAVNACIDAIPGAKNDSIVEDVVITMLKMKGGGKIEIRALDGKGGRGIKVSGNGYTLGGAKNPLPLPEVQRRLRAMVLGDGR